MLKTLILTGVAALFFGTVLVLPQPASANWAAAAAANQATAQGLSDVIEVQRRVHVSVGPRWHGARWGGWGPRWHGGAWWGAPVVAAPFVWGAPYAWAAAPQRCGWVWSPRRARNVWRCW